MMNTNFAVMLGIVYSYLPFMVLPLYANLERLDYTLNEAAMDLGSRPWQVFRDITLAPVDAGHHRRRDAGLHSGDRRVRDPDAARAAPTVPMIGRVIADEFFLNRDWPVASAVAVALLLLLVVPIMIYSHHRRRERAQGEAAMKPRSTFLMTCLCFGFAFFYVPILSMIFFSFNKSRLATVWGGFSTEWYGKLFANSQILDAAVLSASRSPPSAPPSPPSSAPWPAWRSPASRAFRGRTLFSGLVSAPLVMPEVITGTLDAAAVRRHGAA